MPAVAIEQTETKAKEFTFQSDSPADDAAWLNNAIEQQRICAADSVEAADGKVVLKWKRHANKNSVSKWLKSVLGAAKCPVPNGDDIEVKKELKKEPEKEPKRELKQEPEQEPARQLKREPKKEPESELTTVPETEPEPAATAMQAQALPAAPASGVFSALRAAPLLRNPADAAAPSRLEGRCFSWTRG